MLGIILPALAQGPFVWKDIGGGRLELREKGAPVLVYNYGPQLKPGAPESVRRCCYIFPLYSPAGVSLLADFPEGELHHRGLYWAWPVIQANGQSYDLWEKFSASQRTTATATAADNSRATLDATGLWHGGEDIVRENLRLSAFPARDGIREFQIDLTLAALSGPVTLQGARDPGKSFGGLNAHLAPRDQTVIRADGAAVMKDEDLIPHTWAELEGVYQGKRASLRITPDASNPGVPYQWCLRGRGFLGASFPGRTADRDGYTIEPGKSLTLKFRVRVADGR